MNLTNFKNTKNHDKSKNMSHVWLIELIELDDNPTWCGGIWFFCICVNWNVVSWFMSLICEKYHVYVGVL
jgi:hypothetical protein